MPGSLPSGDSLGMGSPAPDFLKLVKEERDYYATSDALFYDTDQGAAGAGGRGGRRWSSPTKGQPDERVPSPDERVPSPRPPTKAPPPRAKRISRPHGGTREQNPQIMHLPRILLCEKIGAPRRSIFFGGGFIREKGCIFFLGGGPWHRVDHLSPPPPAAPWRGPPAVQEGLPGGPRRGHPRTAGVLGGNGEWRSGVRQSFPTNWGAVPIFFGWHSCDKSDRMNP